MIIIEAAKKYGTTEIGMPHPNRNALGDGAMVAPTEWGYWVGADVYVSQGDVNRFMLEKGEGDE